jgi:hypothetical protein
MTVMLYRRSLRVAMPLILACALFPVGAAQARDTQAQQDQSVADAARRSREQKKNATKASKVVTDDDVPARKPSTEGVNAVAPPASDSQPPSPAAASAAETAASGAKDTSEKAGDDPEITSLKAQIAQAAKDLDLLQRELALDQDAYYTKPDYSNDTAGKAKLDAEQKQIADKQQEIEGLKTRLAALEELKSHKKPAPAAAVPPNSDKAAAPPTSQPQ